MPNAKQISFFISLFIIPCCVSVAKFYEIDLSLT